MMEGRREMESQEMERPRELKIETEKRTWIHPAEGIEDGRDQSRGERE